MKQHDFNTTGSIIAKHDSGYNLPETWHNQLFYIDKLNTVDEAVSCVHV